MVNMLKVLVALVILLAIIGVALLGKKITRALILRSAKTSNSESIWVEAICGGFVLFVAFGYYLNNEPEANGLMALGALLFFTGGLFQLIARKQLYDDKTFEERLHSGFELAQTGLYSRIRHPSKTALLLMVAGICLMLGSMWALLLYAVLFFPSVLYRASQEDKTLREQFGERWIAYEKDSKRFIPGVL